MKKFFSRLSRRERHLAVGGIALLLVFAAPIFAFADPGLIEGSAPPDVTAITERPPPAPKPTTTAVRGPRVFCKDGARWVTARYADSCKEPIVCTVDAGDGLYHCVTRENRAVIPPAPTCPQEQQYYYCGGAVVVSTLGYTPPPTVTPPPPTVTVQPTPSPTIQQVVLRDSVRGALAVARAANLRTWVETDLVPAYKAGDTAFRAALTSLAAYAAEPGVTGVKFADNLAFRNLASAKEVRAFLTAATTALRTALPGKQLAVGVVVPELGCGANAGCVNAMRAKYPLVTRALVDSYVRAVPIDRVYVATGLFSSVYAKYGIRTPARLQWAGVVALGWDALAQVGAREYGLAHPGAVSGLTKADVDLRFGPDSGLAGRTVSLWGHKASDSTGTYRLLNAGLATNRLWQALAPYRGQLSVVFDPDSPETGVSEDIGVLAATVSEIFILA
ncbi:hypothetical protein ACIBG8_37140 [Nonomuraea sp. NPDC050556]|uniref:hypothetical protein n=1 Tax=Nonomuraea sp. NPDC050556 TaxID=3364369 RepID=UPI0037A4C4CA